MSVENDSVEEYKITRKRIESLKPSPENNVLYRPIAEDPEIVDLVESIRQHGLRQPLVVMMDNYIVSGHRRHAPLLAIGQAWVPCHVLPMRRDTMTRDEYVALLREHNRQRHKNAAELVREELVDINPEDAYKRLQEQRDKSVYAAEHNGVEVLQIEGQKQRDRVSDDKADHVHYIKKVVFDDRFKYWPLSVRGVH
jgi:ParB-like chromosome segregation protein Spo0J